MLSFLMRQVGSSLWNVGWFVQWMLPVVINVSQSRDDIRIARRERRKTYGSRLNLSQDLHEQITAYSGQPRKEGCIRIPAVYRLKK